MRMSFPLSRRPGGGAAPRAGLLALVPALVLMACAAGTLGAAAEQAADGAPPPPLVIGVLDYAGAHRALARWEPTRAAIAAALPGRAVWLRPLTPEGIDAALAAGGLDFLVTNPGLYADLEYRHHVSRIATAEGDLPVASTLVTFGAAERIGDLEGQRLAVVSPDAFGGALVIRREMEAAEPGLAARVPLVVTGYPMEATVAALERGEADVAVLRACMLERLRATDPDRYGGLRAMATRDSDATDCAVSSPVYPAWPFARTPGTDPDLAKRVAVALLGMQEGNLWTVPVDYQPVHALLRDLQIGPYARSGRISLGEVIRDYREWLIALGIALASWALYSLRIETLVRERTRALKAANADLTREMAERRRAEEADRLHRRELEHVARLSILGEMASSIAHELNQPLGAIASYGQGCLMRLGRGGVTPAEMEDVSRRIVDQAERAALVIRRIRAFVRKRESHAVPVDMAGLVRDCAALFEAATRRAGVRVELMFGQGLPVIRGDRVQLQQVILNLVQNAVDAMEDTPADSRRILIHAAPEADPTRGPGLCLSVRDRGQGFDDATLAHFAEAFYTTKPEGIGLGLALSRSILEAHGGWMAAERPADGAGARIRIWLPADPEDGTAGSRQDMDGSA